jgi:RNA-binding protein
VRLRGGALDTGDLEPDTRPTMDNLPNPHLNKLKAMAQLMDPLLKVGKAGVSEAFLGVANDSLERHELIKIRFDEFKDEKKELTKQLVEATHSRLIMAVGHVIVLYREQPDPAKRKIKF